MTDHRDGSWWLLVGWALVMAMAVVGATWCGVRVVQGLWP